MILKTHTNTMDRSRNRSLVVSFLVIGVFLSCEARRQSIETEYKRFCAQQISFPSKMMCVKNGAVKEETIVDRAPFKFVYYIDSTECSSCSIAHFSVFNRLIDLSEKNDSFDFYIILSPKILNAEELARDISVFEYDFPVYIDNQARFRKLNRHIPSNKLFHQFLLNGENNPVFVGSPLTNKQMSELFDKTLVSLGIIPKLSF